MAGFVPRPPQKYPVVLGKLGKLGKIVFKVPALVSRHTAEDIIRLPARRYPVSDTTNVKHSLELWSLAWQPSSL